MKHTRHLLQPRSHFPRSHFPLPLSLSLSPSSLQMGLSLSSLRHWWFGPRSCRILMVGLDNAGKTTVLYKMKMGEVVHTIPTIGFNVETVTYRNITLTVWDLGGQEKIRCLWHYYFQGTQAVIFVVDAADVSRLQEAREEIFNMVEQDELRDAKILVLANKQDLPCCVDSTRLIQQLGLTEIKGKEWYVQPSNARTGEGLNEGLEWLHTVLSK